MGPARDTKDNCEEEKENYSTDGRTEENAEGGKYNNYNDPERCRQKMIDMGAEVEGE
jgi:hypothetical protein